MKGNNDTRRESADEWTDESSSGDDTEDGLLLEKHELLNTRKTSKGDYSWDWITGTNIFILCLTISIILFGKTNPTDAEVVRHIEGDCNFPRHP